MKKSYLNSLVLLFLFIVSLSVKATTYFIGDSLSDPGALSFTFTDPLYYSKNNHTAGSGKIWTSYFQGISCSAYINLTCTNYAFGGSGVTFSSPYSNIDTSMKGQINLLSNSLSTNLYGNNNVIVWIGANDLIKSAQNNGNGIDQIKSTFVNNILALKNQTRGKVVSIYIMEIPTLLANSPFVTSNRLTNSLNNVISQFNSTIESIPGVTVVKSSDLSSCFPTPLSTNSAQSVCQKSISPNQICGSVNNQLTTLNPASNFLFSDSLHPSSYTHNTAAQCFDKNNLFGNSLSLIR